MKSIKIPLLGRVAIAIVLGILLGRFGPSGLQEYLPRLTACSVISYRSLFRCHLGTGHARYQ